MRTGLLLFMAFIFQCGWSQVEYVMENLVVSDCTGQLVDSGEGEEYSSNENLTFVVDLGEPIPILIQFLSPICIEEDFDFLTIWDGPVDTGVLMAELTGIDFVPNALTANSGMVSFVFTSDNSLNLCGFELEWMGQAPVPVPPIISMVENPECGANGIDFQWDVPLGCADVYLDSLVILEGPAESWDLANATFDCNGDSTTNIFIPFADPIEGNCDWELMLPLAMRDACDSLHHFQVQFSAAVTSCPINGMWSVSEQACIGGCVEVYWTAMGCAEHATEWANSGIGSPLSPSELPDGVDAGFSLCFANEDTVDLTLLVQQPELGLSAEFSYSIGPQIIQITSEIAAPICSAFEDIELVAMPAGGAWSSPAYFDANTWWLDVESAGVSAMSNGSDPISLAITYTSAEGCTLDTLIEMQYVEAGTDFTTCLGGDPIPLVGVSDQPATWWGYVSPGGLFTPDSLGSFELIYQAGGCADTLMADVVPDEPPINLGNLCQSVGWQALPEMEAIGYWTGPGLDNDGFDPATLNPGVTTWLYQLVGCNHLAVANILPIDLGIETFTSCPEQDPFFPAQDASPTGGNWLGIGIASNGLFDPGQAPEGWGQELVYIAPNGCADTLLANNVMTSVAASYSTCDAADPINLHSGTIAAVPWCGSWSGTWPGATPTSITNGNGSSPGLSVTSWCDWILNPQEILPGNYELTFTANTCSATMDLQVYPSELNLDPVVVCSDADPLELVDEDWPLGGVWSGSGVDPITGLLTPSSAIGGWQSVTWTAPGGCVDDVAVNVEAWQQAAFVNLEPVWCFQDIVWQPDLFPLTGTSWTLDGTPMTDVAIAELDTGLHYLTIDWNGMACASSGSANFTLLPPLEVTLTVTDSVICPGTATSAQAEAWGGLLPATQPTWQWSNGGFGIATTTFISNSSQQLIVTASDGCSDPAQDSVYIEVVPAVNWEFTYGDTLCYGEPTSIYLTCQPQEYQLWWDGQTIQPDVISNNANEWVLNGLSGVPTSWQLVHADQGCTAGDEAIPPSYSPVSAGFSVNPGTECIAWDFLPIELIDYSQFAVSGDWNIFEVGENNQWTEVWETPYTGLFTPSWSPEQPGTYAATLTIENEGGCAVSDTASICVHAPVNWFLADQFSPNGDQLNDQLLVRSEPLDDFEMTVFNRWGEQVWQTHDPEEGWDGNQRNQPAPSAVYAVRLNMIFEDGTQVKTTRHVTLVR